VLALHELLLPFHPLPLRPTVHPESLIITSTTTRFWHISMTHQCNDAASCHQPLNNYSEHRFSGALCSSLKNIQRICNVSFFANSEPSRIAEHCSLEADLAADGDKRAWPSSPPAPAEETERLAAAQGTLDGEEIFRMSRLASDLTSCSLTLMAPWGPLGIFF